MTRSLSSLLKGCWVEVNNEDKRIIDTNELVNKRLTGLSQPVRRMAHTTLGEPDEDGFAGGVQAEILEGLMEDGDSGASAVIHQEPAPAGPSLEDTQKQVDQMLADARAQVEAARQEADSIRAQAQSDAANVKENARQEGMQQGYQDGIARADQETNQRMAQLEQKEKDLESAYETKIQELEPQFIDTLTGIYEHIFQVELQGYRDILSYLITNTMRKIEGNRSFFIHVSKEDYPFVSMQKKQFTASVASGSSVEVVEDLTLSKNQCLIETEDGIFDCGVSTQLTELSNRLKLLSYEKE